jgi:hypothetical protein
MGSGCIGDRIERKRTAKYPRFRVGMLTMLTTWLVFMEFCFSGSIGDSCLHYIYIDPIPLPCSQGMRGYVWYMMDPCSGIV